MTHEPVADGARHSSPPVSLTDGYHEAAAAPVPSAAAPATPDLAIEVRGVSRSFGRVHAVRNMDLALEKGKVTALVGKNGCGKSTLMLMIAGLLAPDSGEIRVAGVNPSREPDTVHSMVGWMPDAFGTWDRLTVREVIYTVARTHFLSTAAARERTEAVVDLLDLRDLATQSAHVLSRGQKQRLGLARALVHSPQILVLDEPASGLDPAARRRIFDIIRHYALDGGTVLVSSHILMELEEVADSVVLMDAGTVVEKMSTRDVGARSQRWKVQALNGDALSRALAQMGVTLDSLKLEGTTASGYAEAELELANDESAARFLRDLTQLGAPVIGFGTAAGRLETLYLSLDRRSRESQFTATNPTELYLGTDRS